MGKSLVIVESHEKAITISNILGQDFIVKASVDVLKDLPQTQLVVEADNSFKLVGSPPHITETFQTPFLASGFETSIIATDPDPMGETLAFYWSSVLTPAIHNVKRIYYNELTWPALKAALHKPIAFNQGWIDFQMTQQALDELFRNSLQSVIHKNIAIPEIPNLRQCQILRLLCVREAELESFTPQESWSPGAEFKTQKGQSFGMDLLQMGNNACTIPTQTHGIAIQDILKSQTFVVKDFNATMRSQTPAPPFTTATLIQDAFNRLGFSMGQTLDIARQLYAGLKLGKTGWTGLITFWCTETIRNARHTIDLAREFIWINYGNDYLPGKPRLFKEKGRSEPVIESVRPTDIKRLPKTVKKYLSNEQFQLYDLIWRRFIASQMADARIEDRTAAVAAGEPERFLFSRKSSEIKFRGYLQVYDDFPAATRAKSLAHSDIPAWLAVGEKCDLSDFHLNQQVPRAPVRYSEAELAYFLLTQGLVRPGEIQTIFKFLVEREFISCEEWRLKPLEKGRILDHYLLLNFPRLLDVKFLGRIEKMRGLVETGDLRYQEVLSVFHEAMKRAMKNLHKHPKETQDEQKDKNSDQVVCEQCGSRMRLKNGRHGRFWACSNYPRCQATRPFMIGVNCPMSDCDGQIIERKTKKGTVFFGCSNYPICSFASWHRLIDQGCKNCGNAYLEERLKDNQVPFLYCPKCKKQFSAGF